MSIKQSLLFLDNTKLLKLMRLASPSLPIGSYAYSQGLEFAVASSWVHNEKTASDWIFGILKNSLMAFFLLIKNLII